jgi:prepilin-type N-terminal cleavage/methylation domain-containing protein
MKKNIKGFSLVELLVTVSIVAILSVSASVGWNTLWNSLTLKQSVGVTQDIINRTIQHALMGRFEEATITFNADYLVIDEKGAGSISTIAGCDGILQGVSGLAPTQSLTVESENKSLYIGYPTNKCDDFLNTKDAEWIFTVRENGSTFVRRFVHFNLNREDINRRFKISDVGKTLVVRAPYGNKEIRANGNLVTTTDITFIGPEGDPVTEKLTL